MQLSPGVTAPPSARWRTRRPGGRRHNRRISSPRRERKQSRVESPGTGARGAGGAAPAPSPHTRAPAGPRPPHLVEAALGLQRGAQLLLLLHTHLHHLVQELLFGFLGVQAALQGLPQVLQLHLQPAARGVGGGRGIGGAGGRRQGKQAWGAQVLGGAG